MRNISFFSELPIAPAAARRLNQAAANLPNNIIGLDSFHSDSDHFFRRKYS
jgi:hypothetical protein